MKSKDIKAMSVKEINDKLKEESLNLTKMRLSHAITPMENPMRIPVTRKLIAKLKTELRSRALTSENTTM